MSQKTHVSSAVTATLRPITPPTTAAQDLTIVVLGTAPPQARPVDRPLVVGRDPSADLHVDDPALSRAHVRIARSGARIEIEDLRSRNGTFVDGRSVDRIAVEPPATVRVGETVLLLLRSAEPWQGAQVDGPLVGGSALAPVRRLVALVGPTTIPVLLLGETGTGKEVVARLLHEASGRSGPFIAVNCAALPEALAESELLGHVRGAFTGAAQARKGLFRAAAGGTLFLDEVGELPASTQAKLLRVLEDGTVRPLGSETGTRLDVRIVSATLRDVGDGARFRRDLYARLAGIEVHMPVLRDRREDLPALCEHLLRRRGHGAVAIEADALEALALHEWPMNVRELDAVLQEAMLGGPSRLGLGSLPERIRRTLHERRCGAAQASPVPAGSLDRDALAQALRTEGGNVRQVGRTLGVSRAQLYRLMRRFGIDPADHRPPSGRRGVC